MKDAKELSWAKHQALHRPSREERIEAGLVLKQKRQELLEQGRRIPQELKPLSQVKDEKFLRKAEDRLPSGVATLRRLHNMVPEKRQFAVRDEYCTGLHSEVMHVHPVAVARWWELLRSAPQGLLRFHLRELVPVLEDRMKESKFHEFYESSDIEILKRKGYVFEGRDGEPLKITKEELRSVREAKLYKEVDPRTKSRMKYMIDRRINLKSKRLPDSPTYRPFVYADGDALAYMGYRMYPIYAVMMRIYGEIVRQAPNFAPRSMLDFGAGTGTAIFTAVEVWKGIDPTPPEDATLREQTRAKTYLVKSFRERYIHPRLASTTVKGFLQTAVDAQVTALEDKAKEVKQKVELGLLPSGSDLEIEDAADECRELLSDDVWRSTELWRSEEESVDTSLDEDFLGEGMYASSKSEASATKPFEETDYFLEKDHSAYPKPAEIEALEKRGLNPQIYTKWFNVRSKWASDYYKHVEKKKMERDPSYRPYSAMQYLHGRSEEAQPDSEAPSESLHLNEPEKAIVYSNWEKREPEILSKITAIEPSRGMRSYGSDFLLNIAPHVMWKRFLQEGKSEGSLGARATGHNDLVTCAYTLSELQSETLRADAVRTLWESCTGIMVIVEAGTPAGFKLVLDARNTILEEYKSIGPWEEQPTVLAPCPHDNLRCPVAHSIAGQKQTALRTCFASAKYRTSYVESWVAAAAAKEVETTEEYSYCVIARNEIIPQKAVIQQQVPKHTPAVITADPKKMANDPRLKALLAGGAEAVRNSRYRVPSGKLRYPSSDMLPVPQTEANLNPFIGRWKSYSHRTGPKDLVAMHKERAEYHKAFRDRSWLWNRVVRNPKVAEASPEVGIDMCTPHGTLEATRLHAGRNSYAYSRGLVNKVEAGSLIPLQTGFVREEYILGDTPNTFTQPVDYISPMDIASLRASKEKLREELQSEADAEMDPEHLQVKQSVSRRAEQADAGDAAAHQELKDDLERAGFGRHGPSHM
eukprot:TRINITY_DN7571_c1_g1_i1.p1 TRINITY_DN7571_c1_g1~~TRINITY_DN7571_c1_g1_i1.p1  ORF type:complete len:1018 (+),score=369.32 TRINITY_DN7571_c1_g1_i1:108-3056(+)